MTGVRSSPSRAHVTAWMVSELEETGHPVGDGNVPENLPFGWQGQPNAAPSFFIPWLSTMPGTARINPSQATIGSFADAGSEWVMSYSVSFNAVNREEVEWIADSTRKHLVNVERTDLDCGDYGHWKVQQVRSVSIGGINRVRQTDPDYYLQTDNFDVWISKEN